MSEAERFSGYSVGAWTACRMVHEGTGQPMTPEQVGEYVKNSVVKSAADSGSLEFYFVSVETPDGARDVCHVGNGPKSPFNARLIAAAPALLAENETLRAQLAAALAAPPAPQPASEHLVELIDDYARSIFAAICEGDGQHSEGLDRAIIAGKLASFAAVAAAAPAPQPATLCPTCLRPWGLAAAAPAPVDDSCGDPFCPCEDSDPCRYMQAPVKNGASEPENGKLHPLAAPAPVEPPADLVALVHDVVAVWKGSSTWDNRMDAIKRLTAWAALAPPATPTAMPPSERIETCERCQMKLAEHLGTHTKGVRGSMAWRCAVCLPIEGPSGRLLREEVVRLRNAKSANGHVWTREPRA